MKIIKKKYLPEKKIPSTQAKATSLSAKEEELQIRKIKSEKEHSTTAMTSWR